MNKKPLKPKNGLIIDQEGNKRWYKDDQLHRTDGYAVELIDGTKEFWVNGDECDEVLDFLEYFTGNKLVCEQGVFYLDNGKLHREDGPAIEWADGSKMWYINGEHHREDGPAYEGADGSKEWFLNGLSHREDGPACEWADGSKSWYLHGELHREDGPARERANGDKSWWLNGKLHREDGPACERADVGKEWYINDMLHRENGPAYEGANGDKSWWVNGLLHREDGPAEDWANGTKLWYLNGRLVLEYIVMEPELITIGSIDYTEDLEVRRIMIERYGWERYLTESEAEMLDSRYNEVENTKEALFSAWEMGNQLVVTCPTGRVFVLRVPDEITTCEAAQQWLGNSTEEINVIGRT